MHNIPLPETADLMRHFHRVRPIVLNMMKTYPIHLWEADDYLQEGLICLYELLQEKTDASALPVRFKVKYQHRLLDILRKERAVKRTYDTAVYQDLSDLAFCVADETGDVTRHFLEEETRSAFFAHLSLAEKNQMRQLINGERIPRMQKYRLKQKLIAFLRGDEDPLFS
jgi:competence protein ComX